MIPDITKVSQSRINVNYDDLRSILEYTPFGICFTTPKGEFLYTNKYYQDMVGYSSEELLRMAFFDITHPADLDKNKDLIRNAVVNLSSAKFQKRYLTKSGDVIHVRIIVQCRKDENENTFIVALAEDITELVDYKLKIEQAEVNMIRTQRMNAISELSGVLVHDFNNMLFIIMGYMDVIREESDNGSLVFEYIQKMKEAVKKTIAITSKLLVTTPQDVIIKENINLSKVLDNLKPTLKTISGDKIRLEYCIDDNCIIFAETSQIEQLIINLILNSKDAIQGEGKIEISLNHSDTTIYNLSRYVVLTVKDSGIGIKPENLPYIFEPFFSTKKTTGSSGLGLSSVYGTIQNLNGKIDVNSEVKGEIIENSWTEFKILIPASDKEEVVKVEDSMSKANIFNPKTVLLVDDNDELLKILSRRLSKFHTVVVNHDPTNLNFDELKIYDIIISDISMPKMDGVDFHKLLRKYHTTIPILFLSGFTDASVSELLADKNTQYLMKPVDTSILLSKIEEMTTIN